MTVIAIRKRRLKSFLETLPELPPLEPGITAHPYTHRGPVMPEEFNVLARYNGEVARGLVHSATWHAQMAVLQEKFNRWSEFVALVQVAP